MVCRTIFTLCYHEYMNTFSWYAQLVKPAWAPPSWLFGPVWTILYTVIAVTFGTVLYRAFIGKLAWIVALSFVLNLIFNFAFSPLQFGLRNNLLAAIDIVLVLITLVWALWVLWHAAPDLRWAVYANIPYLLWVAFATVLQIAITVLNS